VVPGLEDGLELELEAGPEWGEASRLRASTRGWGAAILPRASILGEVSTRELEVNIQVEEVFPPRVSTQEEEEFPPRASTPEEEAEVPPLASLPPAPALAESP